MRSIREKAESMSLSDEIFTLSFHARLRAEHPPSVDKNVRSRKRFESLADKRFPRSSSRCRLANAEPLTECDPESMRLVIFLSALSLMPLINESQSHVNCYVRNETFYSRANAILGRCVYCVPV